MKPIYQNDYQPAADEIFQYLLKLNWLSVTEARKEYFMSDVPRS